MIQPKKPWDRGLKTADGEKKPWEMNLSVTEDSKKKEATEIEDSESVSADGSLDSSVPNEDEKKKQQQPKEIRSDIKLSTVDLNPRKNTDPLNIKSGYGKVSNNQLIANAKPLLNSYREATRFTAEDDAEVEKRLKDKTSTSGFMNSAKEKLGMFVNYLTKGSFTKDDPLEDEKKEVLKEASSKGQAYSPELVQTLAEDKYKDKMRESIYLDRANSFLDNLSQDEKTTLKVGNYAERKHLNEDNKKRLNTLAALKIGFESDTQDYEELSAQAQAYTNRKEDIPDELLSELTAKEQEIKNSGEIINKTYQGILKNQDDLGTAQEEYDLFKRENRDIMNASSRVSLAFQEFGAGLIDFLGYAGNNISPTQAMLPHASLTTKIREGIANERELLRKNGEEIESWEGFVNYASDLVADQSVILATTAAGGIGGLGVIGASSTGQKYGEMLDEVNSGKATYNPLQMATVPLLWGGAEVISEIPTLGILKRAGRVLSAVEKTEGSLFRQTMKQKAKEWAKEYAVDMSKEMAGEQFTNFTQNFTERYLLGKKDVGLLDNTGKVFKDTFTLTSILKSSPALGGLVMRNFQKADQMSELDENAKKLIAFAEQLESPDLTPKERGVIQSRVDKLTKKSGDIMNQTIKTVGEMTDEEYSEFMDITQKAGELKASAEEINNSTLSNKNLLLKDLEEEYNVLKTRRNEILDQASNPFKKLEKLGEENTEKEEVSTANKDAAREILDTPNIAEYETAPEGDSTTDGDLQPGAEQVGAAEVVEQPIAEDQVLQPSVEPEGSQAETKVEPETVEEAPAEVAEEVTPVEENKAEPEQVTFQNGKTHEIQKGEIYKYPSLKNKTKYEVTDWNDRSVTLKNLDTGENQTVTDNVFEDLVKLGDTPYAKGEEVQFDKKRAGIINSILKSENELKYEVKFPNGSTIWTNQNNLDKFNERDQALTPVAKPVRKTKQERKAIADAKIDEVADWLKSVLPKAAIDPENYKSQGFTQDQLIDYMAAAAKQLAASGIEISEAVSQVLDALKQKFDFEVTPEQVLEKVSPVTEKAPKPAKAAKTKQKAEPKAEAKTEAKTEKKAIEKKEGSALKNADVAKKRSELGFEARTEPTTKENKALVKEASKKIEEGYDVDNLIDEILDIDSKRTLTDEEVVILKQYQLAKEDELISVNEQIVKATEEGAKTRLDKLIEKRDSLIDDIDKAYRAGEQSGTVTARALQARRIALLSDYSLANMLIQKRKANNNEKLSSEQIQQTVDKYDQIRKLKEQFEEKLKKLQQENTRLRAEKKLTKYQQRKQVRTEKTEKIDKDIQDAKEKLRARLRESMKKMNSNPIPIEFAQDIAQLAILYSQKGIVKLEDIVDDLFESFKDDIPELTRFDIEEMIADIDFEAEAANEKRLASFKKRTRARIDEMNEKVANKDFEKRQPKPLKLDAEAIALQDEYRKAKYEWDKALELDRYAKRTTLEKIRDGATEVFNVPRSVMASVDYSAPLRQGLLFTVSKPGLASKAFVEMFRQSVSQKRFDRWLADLKETPMFELMEKSGLYVADPHNAKLAAKEEQFMSNLAEKIPVLGKGFSVGANGKKIKIGGLNLIGGSERAYVSYLNKMRVDVFSQAADLFEQEGHTFENNPKLFKALADYVNSATGRGDLGRFENSAQILNSTFFSPRLIASRIRLLTNWTNLVWYANTPKQVRLMYAKDMAKLISVGTAILGLAVLGGADVEDDPRSSDFGKIRIGDTRWDIWGGFQQFVRFFSQFSKGERKSTTDGAIRKLDGSGWKGETRADLILRMFRSKLAPVPATAWNLASGKTMVGEEYELSDVPASFAPLFASDLYKAIERDGVAKGSIETGLPAIFGVGVQNYKKDK